MAVALALSLAIWGAVICLVQGNVTKALAFLVVGLVAAVIGRPRA